MSRPTYTARAIRSGKWWAIEVVGLPMGYSQARRLANVGPMARELISLLLEVPEDSLDIEVKVILEGATKDVVVAVERARSELAAAEEASATTTRQGVRYLVGDAGLTVRDAGYLLGISYQRVAQLTKDGS